MYNSIQHFLGFGINKIEKDIKEFLNQGRDFGEFVLKMEENLHELGRNICSEV
ncbi:MAG: ISLre2 family transposase, partial [Tissierellia bacterium]|nr:ISLre2 family transposase [Tissierellia bacterium]